METPREKQERAGEAGLSAKPGGEGREAVDEAQESPELSAEKTATKVPEIEVVKEAPPVPKSKAEEKEEGKEEEEEPEREPARKMKKRAFEGEAAESPLPKLKSKKRKRDDGEENRADALNADPERSPSSKRPRAEDKEEQAEA